MLAFVIFAITFLLGLLGALIWLYPGSRKASTIPGLEPSDPKDGNLGDIGTAGSLHQFLTKLHTDFGDIASFWLGQQFVVSIASPTLFKEHSKVFDRPSSLYELYEPLLTKHSIQYANGAEGRKRRKLFDPAFSHEQVSKNFIPIFQSVVDDMAEKWQAVPREEHLSLSKYMFALTIKAVAQASFGAFFNDNSEMIKLKEAYEAVFDEMESRLGGDIPDPNSSRQKELDKYIEKFNNVMKDAIAVHRKKSDKENNLMDKLISSGGSEAAILADTVTYFIAGFHTTGLLMTWVMYYLATHPEIQDRCYKELIDVLGEEPYRPEATGELKYLKQVIDETMRCSVLAPFAARFQDIDTELGGHKVPAGTPVLQALGVLLESEELWPEPTRFDPDRFTEEKRKEMQLYQYEPFGFAGKRKCPGYRFAHIEAMVFLSVLLRKFKIKLVPGSKATKVYGIVTKPKEELWVTVERR